MSNSKNTDLNWLKESDERLSMKWMRYLHPGLIKNILDLQPDSVRAAVHEPKFVVYEIKKGKTAGIGVSVCSPIEGCENDQDFLNGQGKKFSHIYGRTKAAGRALKALRNRKSSLPIRESFPRRWFPSQVAQLKEIKNLYGFNFKSTYKRGGK